MKKPYAKIAKYLFFVAILAGIVALLIPQKGGLRHPASPSAVAYMKLGRLYLLSTYKSHAGARIRPIQSLEDLFDVEGFDSALLTTYSRITGQETRVAHNPPDFSSDKRWQYNPADILFYFEDPITAYPDEEGGEALPRYFAVTYGGQRVTLAHHPIQQLTDQADKAEQPADQAGKNGQASAEPIRPAAASAEAPAAIAP